MPRTKAPLCQLSRNTSTREPSQPGHATPTQAFPLPLMSSLFVFPRLDAQAVHFLHCKQKGGTYVEIGDMGYS